MRPIRRMASHWQLLGPEVLYWAPRLLQSIWNVKEIYITENGCAASGRGGSRWNGLRFRSRHVSAQRHDAASARDRRGRAGEGQFLLERDGQFRMERRLSAAALGSSMSISRRRSGHRSSARPGFARLRRETRWCEDRRSRRCASGSWSRHAIADEARPLEDRNFLFLAFLKTGGRAWRAIRHSVPSSACGARPGLRRARHGSRRLSACPASGGLRRSRGRRAQTEKQSKRQRRRLTRCSAAGFLHRLSPSGKTRGSLSTSACARRSAAGSAEPASRCRDGGS